MYTMLYSATLKGLEAVLVCVEVDVSYGLPGFSIVGSPSHQIREAQDRVRTALHNLEFPIPPRRVTINLSPGDVPKTGTCFDLPIAAAILETMEVLPRGNLSDVLLIGEISLDGRVRGVRGVLAMVEAARGRGLSACIVPAANMREAMLVEGIGLAGVDSLQELIGTAREQSFRQRPEKGAAYPPPETGDGLDFADVRGQTAAKRAALLAAAGFHNLLLLGPPGSGKSMIAQRIPGILPPLAREEMLEVTRIYSAAGLLPASGGFMGTRPFRAPHHTISPQALAGGGKIPSPGEITLAHRGVLFLDELPELRRESLEILRQPLEEKVIRISRVGGRYLFPADCLLVAAMNPCPCGYYPDRNRCACREVEIRKYLNKISQPLLDRMDLCTETTPPTYEQFRSRKKDETWNSAAMRRQVFAARAIQKERYARESFFSNAAIPAEKIQDYCVTDPEAEKLLEQAFASLSLSGRAINRILKVARTAADLEGEETIGVRHMAEAIGYRSLDKKYWRA